VNVLILHGSPKRDGNSDTLARRLSDGLRDAGAEKFWDYYANEMNIAHCKGCMTCNNSENHACAIQDDMQEIYSSFIDADIVVFATPMFWGYMTSQLKTVLDRMEALAVGPSNWWEGKTFVSIVTYWYHYQSTVAFFERICPSFGVDYESLIYCSRVEGVTGDVHVSERLDKLEEAYNLGKSVGEKYLKAL
jgi:multimeric flavodoxin WrbA